MPNHFWLVWYRAQSPLGPKHWSLFVTYETDDQALGTIYQVEGNGWGTGQFVFRIVPEEAKRMKGGFT
ncbi:hypothetical protein EIP86_008542 [Pleurotus ostreatoroseus]|nr:hypothetical protein EIP86_008542 [Pleurotus ostreatoroseus]